MRAKKKEKERKKEKGEWRGAFSWELAFPDWEVSQQGRKERGWVSQIIFLGTKQTLDTLACFSHRTIQREGLVFASACPCNM